MTELHWALLGVAGMLLALVAGYNVWQQWRAERPAEPASAPGAVGGARIEPRLGDEGAPVPPAWVEDPLVDVVLELRCAHAVDGVTAIDAARRLRALQLPLGATLVAWDARHARWVEPDRFGFYQELAAGAQLAHRRHRLDEIEATRFLACVQQLAAELDADVDTPEAARLGEMAHDLDGLLRRFDVCIGLTLVSERPFAPAALADAMAAGGLSAVGAAAATRAATAAGVWQQRDGAGATVFTAALPDPARGRIELELDVPLAPVAAQPLRALIAAAEVLAARLGARLLDDAGREVTAAALAAIDKPLAELVAQMRTADIEPGSLRAHRLYGRTAR